MIAIKRLQNILWILFVAFGALSAYLISLRVATERNAVQALDRRIASVRGDIRYLETEFDSRANMRQLERWNVDDYRYVAPKATQYLPDERALARLDGVETNGEMYVAPPVMMAMADAPGEGGDAAPKPAESPAPAQIRDNDAMLRVAAAATPAATPAATLAGRGPATVPLSAKAPRPTRAATVPAPQDARAVAIASPVARKAARMALLDAKLLDDGTLRDLGARAALEQRTRSR